MASPIDKRHSPWRNRTAIADVHTDSAWACSILEPLAYEFANDTRSIRPTRSWIHTGLLRQSFPLFASETTKSNAHMVSRGLWPIAFSFCASRYSSRAPGCRRSLARGCAPQLTETRYPSK